MVRFLGQAQSSDGTTGEAVAEVTQSPPAGGGPVTIAAPAPAEPPRLSGVVVPVPAQFDATGATDISNPFREFVAGVPNGATVEFPDGADYWLEQTTPITGKEDVLFRSAGRTMIRQKTYGQDLGLSDRDLRARSFFRVYGCKRVAFDGFTVIGANAAGGTGTAAYVVMLEAQHIWDFYNSEDVTVANVEGSYIYGDFVYWANTKRLAVRNFDFHHNGRQGFATRGGEDALIENGKAWQLRRSFVDLEPLSATGSIRRVEVRNVACGARRLTWYACLGKGYVGDVNFHHNTTTTVMNVILSDGAGGRRGPIRICDNVSSGGFGSPQPCMRFSRTDGIEVTGNYQKLSADRDMTFVQVTDCTDYHVHDNTIPGAARELLVVEPVVTPTV